MPNQENNDLKLGPTPDQPAEIGEDSGIFKDSGVTNIDIDGFATEVGEAINRWQGKIPPYIMVGILTDMSIQMTLQRVSLAAKASK